MKNLVSVEQCKNFLDNSGYSPVHMSIFFKEGGGFLMDVLPITIFRHCFNAGTRSQYSQDFKFYDKTECGGSAGFEVLKIEHI